MPNLDPVPDSAEHLQVQLDAIKRGAAIKVLPYGAITVGEKGEKLADMEAISDKVCAFSDDGKGVQNDEMMREAMTAAKRLGKIIAAHCEDNSLLFGGYIHDGEYARMHGAQGHFERERVQANRARPAPCGGDGLRISRLPHLDKGER